MVKPCFKLDQYGWMINQQMLLGEVGGGLLSHKALLTCWGSGGLDLNFNLWLDEMGRK